MDTLYIPGENDFRKWVKEAVKECLQEYFAGNKPVSENGEPLLSRDEVANILRVSLVTLTDWMKRGLPFHKQRGRVYFIRSEVMEHIKKQHLGQYKLSKRFSAISE